MVVLSPERACGVRNRLGEGKDHEFNFEGAAECRQPGSLWKLRSDALETWDRVDSSRVVSSRSTMSWM